MIRQARESGAEAVVCVMSGCFVQRGEAAITDAHTRAEMLLRGGADAVLELPFPYAAASAEHFARAGVEILERLGVEALWFGSECGDLDLLSRLATLADSETFRTRYAETAAGNSGTAQAFFACLCELAGDATTPACLPNDILGISYLRAIRAVGASIKPATLRREGSAYLADTLGNGYPSATALRRKWREEGVASILPYLPDASANVLKRADLPLPTDLRNAERLILGHFRLTPPEVLESCAELAGGLGSRMGKIAREANTLDAFLSLCATKKYPNARLLRGVLFALTGVSANDLRQSPAYVRLLAANSTGCRFLATARKKGMIPVVTRRADLPPTPEAERQAMFDRRAWDLYDLCRPAPFGTDLWKRAPLILEESLKCIKQQK